MAASPAFCIPPSGSRNNTAPDRTEQEALRSLGRCLGRYELPRQLAELDRCIGTLEELESAFSAGLPEKKKMGLGLACSLGALLLIVLI